MHSEAITIVTPEGRLIDKLGHKIVTQIECAKSFMFLNLIEEHPGVMAEIVGICIR